MERSTLASSAPADGVGPLVVLHRPPAVPSSPSLTDVEPTTTANQSSPQALPLSLVSTKWNPPTTPSSKSLTRQPPTSKSLNGCRCKKSLSHVLKK
jgi:hypothetical protein